jgi:hypothetical protein
VKFYSQFAFIAGLTLLPVLAFAFDREQDDDLNLAVQTASEAVTKVAASGAATECHPETVPSAPVCGNPALSGLPALDLLQSSSDESPTRFVGNLEASRLNPARLEASVSCARKEYGLVWAQGRDPLYQRANGVYAAAELLHVMRERPAVSAAVLKQLKALREMMPSLDPALVLSIAFRESGPNILSSNKEPVGASKVLGGGGLPNLAGDLPELRRKYMPPGYSANWKVEVNRLTKHGFVARYNSAFVPHDELVVAYGATFAKTRDQFHGTALKAGFSQEQLDSLTPAARRVWEALFFAMPGGNPYEVFLKDPDPKLKWRRVGGRTILDQLQMRIKEGKAQSLNDIISLPEFNVYKNVQLAKVASANASVIETLSGIR